ncbi:MAG: amidohydrolase [Halanaerobiales bacterium]|nr:amidohydrolase [Halanaerobiales bacterium]
MSEQKIFINGKKIMNDNFNSFITQNGLIKKIGPKKDLMKAQDENTEIIDLNGRYILPSFTDGHLHYFYYALQKDSIDLKNCKTINEVYDKIRNQAAKSKENEWITVINWDEEKFGGKVNLDRYLLDKISENIPILVKRRCLHLGFVNSKALELAQIDKDTPDPEGGKIVRDKKGFPTGVLQDESISMVDDLVMEKQRDKFKNIIRNSFKEFLSYGITSIHTDDLWQKKYREDIYKSYLELAKNNRLPLDITLQLRASVKEDFDFHQKIRKELKEIKNLNTGAVKFMFDGSLGGRTAALRKPYKDDTTTKGELLFKKEKLESLIDTAYQLNFQPAVHAIGIRAVDIVTKIYEKMNKKYPNKNLRPIIVHASMIDDKLINRIKKNNIILSVQPAFISSDYQIADKRLGKRRARHLYRMRSLIENGITLAGSSDAPVEDINPLLGVYASMRRKEPYKDNLETWQPNETIDMKKALQLYTTGPAFQNFEEDNKGVLKVGQKADFITFKENLLNLTPEKLLKQKVKEIYIDGQLVLEN